MIIDRVKTFSSLEKKKINDENYVSSDDKRNQQAEIKTVSQLKKKSPKPYNYKLIKNLKIEHSALLDAYKLLMRSAYDQDYESIPDHLKKFCLFLSEHLKHEDSEFYLYLDFYYSQGKFFKEQALLKNFRSEMKTITIELEGIIYQSPNIPVTDQTVKGFIFEFDALGKILVERIHREESKLYPLYANTDPQKH